VLLASPAEGDPLPALDQLIKRTIRALHSAHTDVTLPS
jgi:hypothetical protein